MTILLCVRPGSLQNGDVIPTAVPRYNVLPFLERCLARHACLLASLLLDVESLPGLNQLLFNGFVWLSGRILSFCGY